MKNQTINGCTKEIIVASSKFCLNAGNAAFKQFPYPPFRHSFIYDNPHRSRITIRPACSYGRKRTMLKCLFFFLLGALASLVVFFIPWWLSVTLIVLLILFRLVKADHRLREQMDPRQNLHARRSIQKFET
jgi:hypothetical protein